MIQYLKKDGDKFILRSDNQYYTQVQAQMAVTGVNKCDFVVWTPLGMIITLLEFDPVYWVLEYIVDICGVFLCKPQYAATTAWRQGKRHPGHPRTSAAGTYHL